MIRGVRPLTDLETEITMMMANRQLDPGLETVVLLADAEFAHVSSSLIKQIAPLAGDDELARVRPARVITALRKRWRHGSTRFATSNGDNRGSAFTFVSPENFGHDLGLCIRVVLHVIPMLGGQFALAGFVLLSITGGLARKRSRKAVIRSTSPQPAEKTCRLRSTSGPLNIRCSNQSGSRIRSS